MISLMNKISNNNGQYIERKTERYDLHVECKVVVYRWEAYYGAYRVTKEAQYIEE